MKIWKIVLYVAVIAALVSSCASLTPAPSNTIKVLAVTAEGDTIQLDVNSLRPRVYQNIYHTYPYYHNYLRPSPYYGWGWNNYYYVRPSGTRPTVPNVTIPTKPSGTYNKPASSGTGPSLSPSLSTPSSNNNINKGGNGTSTTNRGRH